MARKTDNQTDDAQTEAEAVELPDDADMELGLDHDMDDSFVVKNGDPNYYYFLAANDGDKTRHDGVARCKQMGYEECVKEYASGGNDCTLLRIPMAKYRRRRDYRAAARKNASKARQETIAGIPQEVVRTMERHGPPTVRAPGGRR